MQGLEYDFAKVDPFRNYEKEIDNLDFNKTADGKCSVSSENKLSPEMCAILRNILHDLRTTTAKVGGAVLNVGLRAINFIFKAMELYPNTACGLLIIACIHGISSTIPFFGHILNGLIVPLDAVILASAFIKDLIGTDTFRKLTASLGKAVAAATLV